MCDALKSRGRCMVVKTIDDWVIKSSQFAGVNGPREHETHGAIWAKQPCQSWQSWGPWQRGICTLQILLTTTQSESDTR